MYWSAGDGLADGVEVARATVVGFGWERLVSLVSFPDSAVGADFDGDGDLDPLFVRSGVGIKWRENRLAEASGDFGESQLVGWLHGALSVFAADLDGDGDADLLTTSGFTNEVAWYENRLDEPSADFGNQQPIATLTGRPHSILAADLDGDGDPDVVSGVYLAGQIVWHKNRLDEPSADFGPEQAVSPAIRSGAGFAADIDRDGGPDLLSAGIASPEVAWHENRLDEAGADFAAAREISVLVGNDFLVGANSVFAGDLDGDGDDDVLSASGAQGIVVWYKNPGTDPTNPDTDGDGLSDGAEIGTHGTDPGDGDTDNDGLTDHAELVTHLTNPFDPDSDDDGLTDAAEVGTHGTDPLDGDTDGDALSDGAEVNLHGTDPLDWDSDDDTWSDLAEITWGSDPFDPGSLPSIPTMSLPALALLASLLLAVSGWTSLARLRSRASGGSGSM